MLLELLSHIITFAFWITEFAVFYLCTFFLALVLSLFFKGKVVNKLGSTSSPGRFSDEIEPLIFVFRIFGGGPSKPKLIRKCSPTFYYSALISQLSMILFVTSVFPVHIVALNFAHEWINRCNQ